MCNWRSQAAETSEDAGALAVEHLANAHPSATNSANVSNLRVFEFEQLQAIETLVDPEHRQEREPPQPREITAPKRAAPEPARAPEPAKRPEAKPKHTR